MRKHQKALRAIFLAAIAGIQLNAHAQVSGTWINPSSGTWNIASNWNSNPNYPDAGGTAVFGENGSSRTITITKPITLSGLAFNSPRGDTINGTITLVDSATIFTTSSTTISGPISGSNGLLKLGPGNLNLSSSNSSYTGGTVIREGRVSVGASESPLGAGSIILDGGMLAVGNGISLAKAIAANSGGGTLFFNSGGTPVSVSSPISGMGSISFDGTRLYPTQPLPDYGVRYSGSSDLSGTLSIHTQLFMSGAFPSLSGLIVYDDIWMNMTGGGSNRFGDQATVILRGGSIMTDYQSTGVGTETIGALIVESGYSIVGDQNLKFNVESLERRNHAVLGIGTGGMQIRGTLPTLIGSGTVGTPSVGILPFAVGESTAGQFSIPEPVTVDPTGAVRKLDANEFVTALDSPSLTNSNLKRTTQTIISTPITVNSLTFNPVSGSNGASSFTGTGTVTITSGGLYLANPNTNLQVPLEFGSAEAFIHGPAFDNYRVRVSGSINGTGGLTVSGAVGLYGVSTYTGQTTICGLVSLERDVVAGQPGPLGTDSSPILVESGRIPYGYQFFTDTAGLVLIPSSDPVRTLARDMIFRSTTTSGLFLGLDWSWHGIGPLYGTVSGNIELTGILWLSGRVGEQGFTVSGNISGTGSLLNPKDVILSGNNTFTGGVRVGSFSVMVGSDRAFGAGTLAIASNGTISSFNAAPTLANYVSLSSPSAIIGGSSPITFSGPVDLTGGTRSVSIVNSATTTFSTSVSNGTLTKGGPGTLVMSGLNLRGLRVNEKVVRLSPAPNANRTSSVASLSVATTAGTTLDLTNNDFVLDYTGSAATNGANLRAMLAGGQISSSMKDADHDIGYADNAVLNLATFGNIAVDASSILFRYTYPGDTNLDRKVDATDLGALASHWQQSGQFWTGGDFNYDGNVDIRDLYSLAVHWQAGTALPAGDIGAMLTTLGLPGVEVPEPATLGAISAAIVGSIGRRRRQRRTR